MERLQQKLDVASKASKNLQDALNEPYSLLVRDATIKRFELAYESNWKLLQRYFADCLDLEVNSPRGVWRECLTQKILESEQVKLALQMAQDRNLAVHVYDDQTANTLFQHLAAYCTLLLTVIDYINKKMNNTEQ